MRPEISFLIVERLPEVYVYRGFTIEIRNAVCKQIHLPIIECPSWIDNRGSVQRKSGRRCRSRVWLRYL
jgi:hypothetical protein